MKVEPAPVSALVLGHAIDVVPGVLVVVPPQAAVDRATMASKPIKALGPNERIADRRSSITPPQSECTQCILQTEPADSPQAPLVSHRKCRGGRLIAP